MVSIAKTKGNRITIFGIEGYIAILIAIEQMEEEEIEKIKKKIFQKEVENHKKTT